jgi:hypothetical protein
LLTSGDTILTWAALGTVAVHWRRACLTRLPGGQTIELAPLDDSDTAASVGELLGSDPSVVGWVVTHFSPVPEPPR